jgi:hypothetical protein
MAGLFSDEVAFAHISLQSRCFPAQYSHKVSWEETGVILGGALVGFRII